VPKQGKILPKKETLYIEADEKKQENKKFFIFVTSIRSGEV